MREGKNAGLVNGPYTTCCGATYFFFLAVVAFFLAGAFFLALDAGFAFEVLVAFFFATAMFGLLVNRWLLAWPLSSQALFLHHSHPPPVQEGLYGAVFAPVNLRMAFWKFFSILEFACAGNGIPSTRMLLGFASPRR